MEQDDIYGVQNYETSIEWRWDIPKSMAFLPVLYTVYLWPCQMALYIRLERPDH